MGNILVLRGADFSDAKIATRTVPEATTSSGLYFRYIDSFTVSQSLTGCTSSNHTTLVADGGTFITTLTASAGYNNVTQSMITVVDGDDNPVSFTFSGSTLTIENITTDISITVTCTVKVVTLLSISVSGAASSVSMDTGTEYDTYYKSLNTLKNKINVTASFDDSTTQPVAAADYTLTCQQSLTTEGQKIFTVSYTYNGVTKTAQFTVTYSYTYYTLQWGGASYVSISETLDNATQTTPVSTIRRMQDYSVVITVDSGVASATVNNGTPIIAQNNTISIVINDVTADVTIYLNAAQPEPVINELEIPLYITASEANSKLRLEYQKSGSTNYAPFITAANIIPNLQYSTNGTSWTDFSIDSDNTSYSTTVNLNNIGDTVYIRAKNEIGRTGISMGNVTSTKPGSSHSSDEYYRFSYDGNNIYEYNSSHSSSNYYKYGFESGITPNDVQCIAINVVTNNGSNAMFEAGGNVMSLLYGGDNFKNKTEFPGVDELINSNASQTEITNAISHNIYFKNSGGLTGLFRNSYVTKLPEIHAKYLPYSSLSRFAQNCEKLKDLSNINLSLIHCSDFSCMYMFTNCTNVEQLPSVSGVNGEYYAGFGAMNNMFANVNSTADVAISDWRGINLPTILTYLSCSNTFGGCTNMQTSPDIVAQTLVPFSCASIFMNCTSLNNVTIESTQNAARTRTNNDVIYGLGMISTTTAVYKGWNYVGTSGDSGVESYREVLGSIHVKQAFIDTIPELTTAILSDASITNAKKYHAAGIPVYMDTNDGNKIKPWVIDIDTV